MLVTGCPRVVAQDSHQVGSHPCRAGDDAGLSGAGGSGDAGREGEAGASGRQRRSMRFIQLYTSPSFRYQRSKLVAPSEDWEQSERDVKKHKFSPVVSGCHGRLAPLELSPKVCLSRHPVLAGGREARRRSKQAATGDGCASMLILCDLRWRPTRPPQLQCNLCHRCAMFRVEFHQTRGAASLIRATIAAGFVSDLYEVLTPRTSAPTRTKQACGIADTMQGPVNGGVVGARCSLPRDASSSTSGTGPAAGTSQSRKDPDVLASKETPSQDLNPSGRRLGGQGDVPGMLKLAEAESAIRLVWRRKSPRRRSPSSPGGGRSADRSPVISAHYVVMPSDSSALKEKLRS